MHIARASNAPHHKTLLRSGAARATPVCRHRQWHSGLTATPVMTMRWRSCSLRSTQVRPVPLFSRVLACARGARCARWRQRPCRQRGLRSNTPSVWRPAPRLRAPVCATRCEGRQEDAGRPRPLTRLPVRTHACARTRASHLFRLRAARREHCCWQPDGRQDNGKRAQGAARGGEERRQGARAEESILAASLAVRFLRVLRSGRRRPLLRPCSACSCSPWGDVNVRAELTLLLGA